MARNAVADAKISMTSIFGGSETQVASQQFKGGRVNAIFGSGDLDLQRAGLGDSGATVNVIAIFGRVTIRVPSHWDVNLRSRAVFGGVESKRTAPTSPEGELAVTGWCLFGGVGIRS